MRHSLPHYSPGRDGCTVAYEAMNTLEDLRTGHRKERIAQQFKAWPREILEGLKGLSVEQQQVVDSLIAMKEQQS